MTNIYLADTSFQNSPFMFILAGIVVLFVIAMSVIFLVKAYREGMKRGLAKEKLNGVIKSTAIFTIAPSIAILITVLTLAGSMGFALPWLRLSVIGAITYEATAAESVATAMGETLSTAASSPKGFVTIAYVMTLGIIVGLIYLPIIIPKITKGMDKVKQKDQKWGKIFSDSLFMGLISAFLGVGISGKTTDRLTNTTIAPTTGSILVSVLTLATSALLMAVCGILLKKFKWKWLENYAMPICLIVSMGMAIAYNAILPASLFVAA